MQWYQKLYLGPSLSHKGSYYRKQIEKTKKLTGLYCILLSPHPGCLLDICKAEMLRHPQLFRMGDMVVGIAGTRRESRELAGRIILDALTACGSPDLNAFFGRQETGREGNG